MASNSRRTTIIEAAWRTIAQSGVRNFRVEEVAADAGVSIGLIYYHFKDRIGLLRATMEYANQMTPVIVGADEEATGLERLTRTVLADFRGSAVSRDNAVVWYELVGAAIFEPDIRAQVRATLGTWQTGLEDAIRAGQADGSIRSEIDLASTVSGLTALVDGLLSHVIIDGTSWASAVEILRQVLEGLAATDRP